MQQSCTEQYVPKKERKKYIHLLTKTIISQQKVDCVIAQIHKHTVSTKLRIFLLMTHCLYSMI